MTIAATDRTEMADSDQQNLDTLFELLCDIVPEGYKAEIVGGAIHMSPQRRVHWTIIRRVLRQLEDRFGDEAGIDTDVRLDLPGYCNGFAPDLYKIADGAEPDAKGRWRYQDVEFVLEVISRGTAVNDYGPKKAAYAAGGIPVYLIADPYTGLCHLHTMPKDDEYRAYRTLDFGMPIDLTDTPLGMILATDGFPREPQD
ncbi:Uma2 family endonuclease [Streptomyces sp. NPDC052496]|uniref:Uma2 family endonuclease n=1 Tax=Streptomyces sp. NPDC052496 TaxID=3154951 RepID=UPI0034488B58